MEKKVISETIYTGKVLQLTKDTVELDDKKTALREVVHHCGGVAVIVTYDDKMLFVKQYRYAKGEYTLEIPAGKLESNEFILECAKRELEEETGLTSDNFEYLGNMYPTPGYSTEVLYLYLVKDVKKVINPKACDEDENIELVEMTINEAYEKCIKGDICDAKTMYAIMYVKNRLDK